MIIIRKMVYPVYRLHELHNIQTDVIDLDKGIVMVLETNQGIICLFIDRILDQIETVIKPLSNYIGNVQGISGCNILGDGEISLILDIEKLAEGSHHVSVI